MKFIPKLILPLIFFLLLSFGRAFAEFRISARPYEGGYDLGFGSISSGNPAVNKEIIVAVNSDQSKQYEVVLTLLDPLTNTGGATVDSGNFSVSAVRGSNRSGTLFSQDGYPVSFSRSIIYTSNTQGLGDSFKLVFSLKGASLPAGSYRGRIAFTLEPVNASLNSSTAVLNITAEVSASSSVEINTGQGSRMLSLRPAGEKPFTDRLGVKISGATGKQFHIFQQLSAPFESSDGSIIEEKMVVFKVEGADTGNGPSQPTELTQAQQTLYTSGSNGQSDEFTVTYSLKSPETLTAGKYRSRLGVFTDASASSGAAPQNFDFEIEVPRVLDLVVTPQSGGSLNFQVAPADKNPVASEVAIEVKINSGKQYQISQKFSSQLVNKQGQVIPDNAFTFKMEKLGTKGKMKFIEPEPVKSGDTVIFISDSSGSPDKFKVIYELKPGTDVPAGNYETGLVYSISEI